MTTEKTTATFLGRQKKYGKWIPLTVSIPSEIPRTNDGEIIKYCKDYVMDLYDSEFAEITKFKLN